MDIDRLNRIVSAVEKAASYHVVRGDSDLRVAVSSLGEFAEECLREEAAKLIDPRPSQSSIADQISTPQNNYKFTEG